MSEPLPPRRADIVAELQAWLASLDDARRIPTDFWPSVMSWRGRLATGKGEATNAKLDVHVLLGLLAQAARGEPLDPETCAQVEQIAEDYGADFSRDDIQALYDCGGRVAPAALREEIAP